jgi:hypothetical protein
LACALPVSTGSRSARIGSMSSGERSITFGLKSSSAPRILALL